MTSEGTSAMTDFTALRQWVEQYRGRYKPNDACFEIYEDAAALLDLYEWQQRELARQVVLDDYEISNLRAAIEAMGYPQGITERNPLWSLNTGDWLGQIYLKLPETSHRPNKTAQEMAIESQWELRFCKDQCEQQQREIEELRGAMAAQDRREQAAGEKCGVPWHENGCDHPDAMAEEVLRLRAERDRLRAALKEIEDRDVHDHNNYVELANWVAKRARAALRGGEPTQSPS